MNSPIKLPPLPAPLREIAYMGGKPQDVYGIEEMRAYAEQAVRDALAEAAAICNRKFLAMAADGYPREASTARRLTAQIEALIPENNHAEGADQEPT